MDLPSTPEDVLAQPTRARLFALLGELRRPATTDELARAIGRHPNGVRLHLERLAAARLIVRERARQPRGRPRDLWRISADARPGGAPPHAYADVARWLARALADGEGGRVDLERAGRRIGRELAPSDDGARPVPERFFDVLAALGFQPRRERRGPNRIAFRLDNCPYRAVAADPERVVCRLHRGITLGLVDGIAPGLRLTAFVARDPDQAGCCLELSGASAAQPTTRSSETTPSATSATTVTSSRPT